MPDVLCGSTYCDEESLPGMALTISGDTQGSNARTNALAAYRIAAVFQR
jgi:hypothetical protein